MLLSAPRRHVSASLALLVALLLTAPELSAQSSTRSVFGPSTFQLQPGRPAARGYVPKHARLAAHQAPPAAPVPRDAPGDLEQMPLVEPEPEVEPMPQMLAPEAGPEYYDEYPLDLGPQADCGPEGCGTDCLTDGCPPVAPGVCWDGCELFSGVQGFTGPINRGSTGSFGFHQGINLGSPLTGLFGDAVAGQLGVRTTQSNFNEAAFTSDERHQVFVTGGLFRRVDWGLQGGLVVDYYHEGWYFDADWVQLRGELSWVFPCEHELGFWFAANDQWQEMTSPIRDANGTTWVHEYFESTDLYAFFYRHRDDCGGTTWRAFAGFTGESDGLLGADLVTPLNASWGLRTSWTYLVPNEGGGQGGYIEESWNVSLSIVWRPGCGFTRSSYYQPLFDVASNGTFLIDWQ